MNKGATSYEDSTLYPMLRDDREFALSYLNDCFEDDDPRLFLLALRQVAEAWGVSKAEIATAAGLDRTAIYKAFSKTGNPSFTTLKGMLDGLGLKIHLSFEAAGEPTETNAGKTRSRKKTG